MIVLVVSSVLVLEFEITAPPGETPNIATGGDALWWAIVTITTVGYGDFYPVTTLGRLTGVFVMFAGVGIIGALASILASILVPDSSPDAPSTQTAPAGTPSAPVGPANPQLAAGTVASPSIEAELASLRMEIASLRRALSVDDRDAAA